MSFKPYGPNDPELVEMGDFFAKMNIATGECLLELEPQISFIMKNSGVVEGDPTKISQEILEDIRQQFDEFEMPNANWNMAKEYDDLLARGIRRTKFRDIFNPRGWIKSELNEILLRVREHGLFRCDKEFGFEEDKIRPKTLGEKFGEQLMEGFRLAEKQRFQAVPEEFRNEQRNACAKAVNAYIISFDLCLRKKIPELS